MDKMNEEEKKHNSRQNYENLAVKYYNRFLISNGYPARANADICDRLANQLQMVFRINWETESVEKTANDMNAAGAKAELIMTNMAEVESYSFGFLEQSHELQTEISIKTNDQKLNKGENFSRPSAKAALNEYQQQNNIEASSSLFKEIIKKLGF